MCSDIEQARQASMIGSLRNTSTRTVALQGKGLGKRCQAVRALLFRGKGGRSSFEWRHCTHDLLECFFNIGVGD